jgi:hypothetical protein
MADWDARFIELARHVAEWSKDRSTKVGAVISTNGRNMPSETLSLTQRVKAYQPWDVLFISHGFHVCHVQELLNRPALPKLWP